MHKELSWITADVLIFLYECFQIAFIQIDSICFHSSGKCILWITVQLCISNFFAQSVSEVFVGKSVLQMYQKYCLNELLHVCSNIWSYFLGPLFFWCSGNIFSIRLHDPKISLQILISTTHTTTLILDCHSYSFSYYLAYFVSKRHSKVKPSITAQHFFVLI